MAIVSLLGQSVQCVSFGMLDWMFSSLLVCDLGTKRTVLIFAMMGLDGWEERGWGLC